LNPYVATTVRRAASNPDLLGFSFRRYPIVHRCEIRSRLLWACLSDHQHPGRTAGVACRQSCPARRSRFIRIGRTANVRDKADRGTANRYGRTGAIKFLARDEAGLLEKKLRRQTRNVAFRNSFSMTRVTTTTIPPPRRPLHDRPATFQKQRCCLSAA
jgi:hypothetical protein